MARAAIVSRPEQLTPTLASLPATRREILVTLRKRGEASVDELAEVLGVTVSAVRQHLTGLAEVGFVSHRAVARGPGRPRHLYRLSAGAEALFPKYYSELTNELLSYVEDEDPEVLERIFERRRQRRVEGAATRLEGKPFREKVAELARILDEDGYLADFEALPDGSFVITEHNCAILGVARRWGLACSTEIEFLREALPEASVERVAHMMAGAHVCRYEVTLRRPAARRRP
jgi:DeoR family transcriptional regulator, suf operon transcriptional repressor